MRTRDVTIPLGLWICAAICAHFFFGTGGLVVAKVHDDRSELWRLSREASDLAQQGEQTFEVTLAEPSDDTPGAPPPPPAAAKPPPPPPPAPTAKPNAPKPDETPKEEKRTLILEKKADEKKALVHEQPLKDRRIAVVQHAKPDQDDNPTAKYVADQANRVKEETRATQTSHDRDDEHPTPATNHAGSDRQPGDSEKDRVADSASQKGDKNRAPGERGTDVDVQHEPKIARPEPRPPVPMAVAAQPASAAAPRNPTTDPRPSAPQATANEPQPAPGGAVPSSPEVDSAPGGTWTFNPARQGGAAGAAVRPNDDGARSTLPGGRMWAFAGLGQGASPGSFNTNLSLAQVAAVVGSDSLRKLREADGERRLSEHRGSWSASNFERWRSAIENYVSSVKPGNQTALNTARVPFAAYLNGMHNRIHPIFAESFLESLDALPASDPRNDQRLVTTLEIVLTRDGHLKRMGIVRTSGITLFDIAALDAVDRAQPFGPAPSAIVSPDGNVYLHWEFHRDEVFACSTMGAMPFILNVPAPTNEPPPQLPSAPAPGPAKERGVPAASPNDAREGANPQRRRSPLQWET
jgi:TonB family protein